MRIGIFGGTFNPIHTGHLIVAQDALEALKLDRVLFVPCAEPPHKKLHKLASAEHRLRMIKAAIKQDKRFAVSDIELKRGGRSYTIDTVRALCKQQPAVKWYFIIGSDSFIELHAWRDIETLARLCLFAVVARPGFDANKLVACQAGLDAATFKRASSHFVHTHLMDISSTEIRARVRSGQSISYFVPRAVATYIRKHSLYNNENQNHSSQIITCPKTCKAMRCRRHRQKS